MPELVVDLTPACINRTAIHHIAVDTYAALAEWFDTTPQYMGRRHMGQRHIGQRRIGRREVEPASRESERSVARAFYESVRRWAAASVHADEIAPFTRLDDDRTPRLYFDPIYTLARDLQANDVVFVLDMSPLTNPEWHQADVAVAYERAFRKLTASPAKIVCISDHCAVALRTSFAIPQHDIVTVPLYLRTLSTRDVETPPITLQPRKFFLCVGSLETRKNLVGLMHAFALTGLAEQGWTLVIAGGKGHGHEAIVESAVDLVGVELLGFVSDKDLAWLYANAAAFVYPSFLEGFGLPLLEAMAWGLPCLASITGASREVCGPDEPLVDPYHVPSIAAGLVGCVRRAGRDDPRARAARQAWARQFTFQRYIDALLPVFDREAA